MTVANLGSHVLALAAARVVADWPRRYGVTPVLLETFVDERRFAGTVYQAANWQRLGETAGRGRQDRDQRGGAGVKAVYVLALQRDWRRRLCQRPAPVLRLAPPSPEGTWAEVEFGRVDFPDARLRLLRLAAAFFDHPSDPVPAIRTRSATAAVTASMPMATAMAGNLCRAASPNAC